MDCPFSCKVMTDSPIKPPSLAIIKEWIIANGLTVSIVEASAIASLASRLGADQELEACCLWLNGGSKIDYDTAALLRAARRPKSPSLKEQALAELEILSDYAHGLGCSESAIRRALEALPND